MAARRVAYSGEPGAFAEDAVVVAFGDVERAGLPGFRAVFESVTRGTAGVGVVPIENLVQGSVREVYDLLLEFELSIVGEVVVPVELCLAALPGTRLEEIQRVYSHIQALGQAERYLRDRRWNLLTAYNTAGAGQMLVDRRERGAAAVLSSRAAERLDLEVLATSIQDVPDNRTRFVVLGTMSGELVPPPLVVGGAPRTTLAFAVRNEPGQLLAALRVFAERGINLSKLESRPSRSAAWEYVFWADLDADRADPTCAGAIAALDDVVTMVRILGSYPRSNESGIGGRAATRGSGLRSIAGRAARRR